MFTSKPKSFHVIQLHVSSPLYCRVLLLFFSLKSVLYPTVIVKSSLGPKWLLNSHIQCKNVGSLEKPVSPVIFIEAPASHWPSLNLSFIVFKVRIIIALIVFFVDKFEILSEKNECEVATQQFDIFRSGME